MNLINGLKFTRNERGLSEIFPITHLNSPEEFETKTGAVGATIELKGVPFETMPDELLNHLNATLHQAMMMVDETMMIYITTHRKRVKCELNGAFPSYFSERLNDKYHKRFNGKRVYQNKLYLTVLVRGDNSSSPSKVLKWAESLAYKKVTSVKQNIRAKQSRKLQTVIKMLCAQLLDFRPDVLGENQGKNELLQFLSLIVNGGEGIHFKTASNFHVRAKSNRAIINETSAYQESALGHYVGNKRLLFGDYIQFQGAAKSDVRFGVMLSLKKYPTNSTCESFDPLYQLDCEFIATHTFAPSARHLALKKISLSRSKHEDVEDKGQSQIDDLSLLEDDIACERATLGLHHNSIMLINETPEQLEEDIVETVKAYAFSGMTVVREMIGSECAFWSQIPGNEKFIIRASLISSHNFVDFCSMHNYQVGHNGENHLGSAVTLVETPSKTPAFFNWHSTGSKENPAKGLGLVIAPTDAGKTSLVNFTCSQMRRFDGRVFYLDRDLASKVYVLAEGGTYIHYFRLQI